MTRTPSEERFREAAEAEDGIPVSAGARISHVRTAAEAGRVFYVDLSSLPEDERPAVLAESIWSIGRLLSVGKGREPREQTRGGVGK